ISKELGFLSDEKSQELMNELNSISKMLQGLIKSINK
ncbi:MAG: hypothetical protein H6Q19_1576, partial [Bacteroidetes bacterium]|nr:hypothetical protein [Bacteroidota bacterium]